MENKEVGHVDSEKIDAFADETVETTVQHVDTSVASGEAEVAHRPVTMTTILAFVALCGQFNAYVMTLLIPSTNLAYINADLGPDPNYTWITVSWQLGASVVVSVGGRLSDIFGRRYFMLTGACLGVVGCVVGATAQSINQMIASGIIFGFASGFQEMSYAAIQEILPNKYRMVGVGIFDASLLLAYFSPLISYAFIAYVSISWRASYWYMFSFHTLMAVLLFFCYHPPDFKMKHRTDGKSKMQLLGELDYVGLFLFATANTLMLLGINFGGGGKFPWKSATVIAPIVVGFMCAVVLGFWETRPGLKYPLLPPKLFKEVRGFVMVIVVCFVGGMLYYSMNVLWPRQSAQFFVPADDVIMRGLYSTIFSFGSFIGAFLMMFLAPWLGKEKWQMFGYMVIQTAFIASMASVGVNDKARAIILVLCTSPFVTVAQLLAFTMISLGIDDQNDIGIAVGLCSTFRLMGGAVATTVYSAILNNRFASVLDGFVDDAAAQVGLAQSSWPALVEAAKVNTAAAYAKVPGMTKALEEAARMAVKLSYVQAFKLVYLVAIGFGGAAIIAASLTKNTDTSRKNDERAVVLKNEG
ncbi:fungal trichothecene efflux pump [Coniochaeta sp. 2T2.1]|nr:fungal trichothecene efflux pump [Coniochaeta sp. 2T2.1]